MSRQRPGATNPSRQVFSDRLREFLDQLQDGATPNFGRFCCFCYNPLPQGFERCDHCGQSTSEREPLESVPQDVLDMHRRKLKRESLVVNSFAYFGLALGLGIFLGMVAINVLYMEKALWFFILATFTFLVGSRLLAGIFGGVIGDEIGFRYANKHLAEDWATHLTHRETARQE
jgi:rRNA maturation protein Nop10